MATTQTVVGMAAAIWTVAHDFGQRAAFGATRPPVHSLQVLWGLSVLRPRARLPTPQNQGGRHREVGLMPYMGDRHRTWWFWPVEGEHTCTFMSDGTVELDRRDGGNP